MDCPKLSSLEDARSKKDISFAISQDIYAANFIDVPQDVISMEGVSQSLSNPLYNNAKQSIIDFSPQVNNAEADSTSKPAKTNRPTKNKQSWVFLKGYGERLMTPEGMMIKCLVNDCGRLYKTNNGSTTSMRNHLQAIHDIEEYPGRIIKRIKSNEKADSKDDIDNPLPNFVKSPSQFSLPTKSEVTDIPLPLNPAISTISQSNETLSQIPFHILCNDKLSNFLQLPINKEPQECFAQVSNAQVLDDLKTQLDVYRTALKFLLRKQTSISLSVMRWPQSNFSESTNEALTVTAHFINSDWTLKDVIIAILSPTQGFTGIGLAQSILEVLDDFGIASIFFTITTDNSPTMRLMVEELGNYAASRPDMIFDPVKSHIPCMGYIINEVVNGVLKHELRAPPQESHDSSKDFSKPTGYGPISTRLDKFRFGINTVKNSHHAFKYYQNLYSSGTTKYQELFIDQIDSWDSTLRLIDNIPHFFKAYNDTCIATNLKGVLLSNEDIDFCEELKNFLGPFQALSARISCTRYLNVSRAIVTYDKMLAYMSTPLPQKSIHLRLCYFVARNSLLLFFGKTDHEALYPLAMTLDPRIKWDFWKAPVYTPEDTERLRSSVLNYWNKIPHPSQTKQPTSNSFGTTSSLSQFDTIFEDESSTQSDEFQRYLQEPIITTGFNNEEGVWDYWRRNASNYPYLAPLARKFLAVPVFSKPCSPTQLVHLDSLLPSFSQTSSFLSNYMLLQSWKKVLNS